jgi:acyl transferase domain-containing protein
MGTQLYETQPTFRKTLDRCQEILCLYLDKPLLEILSHSLDQPALFALEYALFQLWKSWGIQPAAVIGYGVGEYVAACVAGVFSLEDGLKLIAERGRLMQVLPQDGEIEKSNGSPVVETALGEFEQVAKEVTYSQPKIPLVSSLTGELATPEIATPNYWCRQAPAIRREICHKHRDATPAGM